MRTYLPSFVIFSGCLIAAADTATAADTVETFDVGLTNVELYGLLDGIGADSNTRTSAGEIVIGVGVVSSLSVYFSTSIQADHIFSNTEPGLSFGVFGTPIDTEHLDLDLILDISGGGNGLSEATVTPGLEINLDWVAGVGLYGIYLRGGVPIAGRQHSTEAAVASSAHHTQYEFETCVGAYYTVSDGHQMLVEYDMVFTPATGGEKRQLGLGGVGLGYNVAIADTIELITQLYVNIPEKNEATVVGAMIGFIGTLPTVVASIGN